MKARDAMSKSSVTVSPETTCLAAAKLITDNRVGALAVIGEGDLIHGVLTDRDLVTECMSKGLDPSKCRVHECLPEGYAGTHPTFVIDADADIEEAIQRMHDEGVHRLLVTEKGTRLVGMLSFDDVAYAIRDYLDKFLETAGAYRRK